MRALLIRLRARLRTLALPAGAGPLPLAAEAMLGHACLAPHLIRLSDRHPAAGRRGEA